MMEPIPLPEMIGLDLETAPCTGMPVEYALQPWRASEGTARITSCAIAKSSGESITVNGASPHLKKLLAKVRGKVVITWSGIFDVSWLIASKQDVSNIHWMDAMLLWKWVDNCQEQELQPSWSLVAGCRRWLSDLPWIEKFIEFKNTEYEAGENHEYWEMRGQLDSLAAVLIAERVWPLLTPKQQRSAIVESMCLVPFSTSWVNGIDVDAESAASMAPVMTKEMREIEQKLDLITPPTTKKKDVEEQIDGWVPSKILRSPKQLGELLYGPWGLECKRYTDAEPPRPSTDKTALTYLADHDDRVLDILRWRELNTQYTKFIKGIEKAYDYLGTNIIHPQPKLFSTYTGRVTYKSKCGTKGPAAKAKIGVAIHQWPRPKPLRKLIRAPKGKLIVEYDAAGQEMRFMALKSKDRSMLRVFGSKPPYDDAHSFTGAALSGMSFEAFLEGKRRGNDQIVGDHGYRYQGKFTNLSCQYRIGVKKLRFQARVQYGMNVDWATTKQWQDTYFSTYPGVRDYWGTAINEARSAQFAETLGGRRFGLTFWDNKDTRWGTESSAINHPIQGTGADQKELALATMTIKFPSQVFMMDLHDGLFFLIDDTPEAKAEVLRAREALNNLDYESVWGYKPEIPLLWDASIGSVWSELEEL